MHRRMVGVRRVPGAQVVRRGAILLVVNNHRIAREYNSNNTNYTDHPILIKDNKSYYINNEGEIVYI